MITSSSLTLNVKNEIENYYSNRLYVQIWGTKEECEKYTVKISLGDEMGRHFINFCDHPLPIELSKEELMVGGILVGSSFMRRNLGATSVQPSYYLTLLLLWQILGELANLSSSR